MQRFLRALNLACRASEPSLGNKVSPDKVFPCRPPFEFEQLPKGGRKAARKGALWRAQRWVNATFGIFSFLESGLPNEPQKVSTIASSLAASAISPVQQRFANNMLKEALSFCRVRRGSPCLGRGLKSFQDFISKLSVSQYNKDNQYLDTLTTNALPVLPERLGIPKEPATCDPAEHLTGEFREQFKKLPELIGPEATPLPSGIRACHLLSEEHELAVNEALLEAGLCVLINEDLVPRDTRGNALSGGLFCVVHKLLTDRLINDRRPLNAVEGRLGWAKLPHGSLLCQLIVNSKEVLRGHGEDLSKYFYKLKHHIDWVPRNNFGRKLQGSRYTKYGGIAGKSYYMAFVSVCMGDSNAVDIAQQTHSCILQRAGCLQEQNLLIYGHTVPVSKIWDGLYIDDHIAIAVGDRVAAKAARAAFRWRKRQARKRQVCDHTLVKGGDLSDPFTQLDVMFDEARKEYASSGLEVALDKEFRHQKTFCAWGTEVDDESGWVGTPVPKRRDLAALIAHLLALNRVTKKCMQQVLGLLVHPFSHRRILMSAFHHVYRFVSKLPENTIVKLPPLIRDELVFAVLLLPFAHSNVRWPVSQRVTATDSTTTMGAGVETFVPKNVAEALYRWAEFKGEYVRLDWDDLDHQNSPPKMHEPQECVHSFIRAARWKVTRKYKFKQRSHVNLQETRAIRAEVKEVATKVASPCRVVNLVDTRVGLGAVAKGRSSSHKLNGVLRSFIPYAVGGQKHYAGVWTSTVYNTADDPTRHVAVREPVPDPDPWVVHMYGSRAPADYSLADVDASADGGRCAHEFAVAKASPGVHKSNVSGNNTIHTKLSNRSYDKTSACHKDLPPGAASSNSISLMQAAEGDPVGQLGGGSSSSCGLRPKLVFREVFAGCGALSAMFRKLPQVTWGKC